MPTPVYDIKWDATGERYYETGTDRGVLYELNSSGAYVNGVAWNGLTAVTENATGGEPNDLWADNIKYATLRSAENFGATIEAYQSPPEFDKCDGSATIAQGVTIAQQSRATFGFSYRTMVGNDTATESDDGYKIHLVYGATASPSDKNYQTINESPDAISLSWEITTVPVPVAGHKPTAHLIIDSRNADATKLTAFEQILYGTPASGNTDAVPGRMPLPDEVATLMTPASTP